MRINIDEIFKKIKKERGNFMEKNQNINLFSDSKAENEETDNKTKTLFITLNGKKVEMPIEEIFGPSQ